MGYLCQRNGTARLPKDYYCGSAEKPNALATINAAKILPPEVDNNASMVRDRRL